MLPEGHGASRSIVEYKDQTPIHATTRQHENLPRRAHRRGRPGGHEHPGRRGRPRLPLSTLRERQGAVGGPDRARDQATPTRGSSSTRRCRRRLRKGASSWRSTRRRGGCSCRTARCRTPGDRFSEHGLRKYAARDREGRSAMPSIAATSRRRSLPTCRRTAASSDSTISPSTGQLNGRRSKERFAAVSSTAPRRPSPTASA